MIMIQQLIQYMVYQINIDLVYDIQFETNITKMDQKLITKQFVKDPSGQCKRENQQNRKQDKWCWYPLRIKQPAGCKVKDKHADLKQRSLLL